MKEEKILLKVLCILLIATSLNAQPQQRNSQQQPNYQWNQNQQQQQQQLNQQTSQQINQNYQQQTKFQYLQPQQANAQQQPHYRWNSNQNNQQQTELQSQQQQEIHNNQQYTNWQAARQRVIDAENRLIQHQQSFAQNVQQNQADTTNKLQSTSTHSQQQQQNLHKNQQVPINDDEQQHDSVDRNIPQHTTNNKRRPEVSNQGNEDAYKRRKGEPFEGEGDIEFTKSQEAELVTPTIGWKIKNKKYEIPYTMDRNVRWTADDYNYIKKHLQLAGKRMKVIFKERDYETYYLVISLIRQCIAYSVNQHQPDYKEIYICLDNKTEPFNEIYRATQIGFQVNESITEHESSEEVHDETEEESESENNDESDEEVSNEEHDESY